MCGQVGRPSKHDMLDTLNGFYTTSSEIRRSSMKRVFIVTFAALLVQGCMGIGHKDFYTQVAPIKYPPTEKTMVFEYANVNLKEIYDLLFSDFLIIGRSSFNDSYENPTQSIPFAKSIGTDIFLATSQFKETRISFMNLTTASSSTTHISGNSSTGSFQGTAITYDTRTTIVPVTVNQYDQDGLFLRNVNSVVPLWERTEVQYIKTEPSDLEGIWFNENYKLNLYRSGQQLVAFLVNEPKNRDILGKGRLKLIYGVDSGVGVYLMGNKTPMPARFKLNKFGHLEVTLVMSQEMFSFAR